MQFDLVTVSSAVTWVSSSSQVLISDQEREFGIAT
jgi:hypothetical protein